MRADRRYKCEADEGLPPSTREGETVWLFLCGACGRRYADPPAPVRNCGCGGDTECHRYPTVVYDRLATTLVPKDVAAEAVEVAFRPDLLEPVLEGEKTVTFRLGFDHDLTPGDRLALVDAPTRTPLDTATTVSYGRLSAEAVVQSRFAGHEPYASMNELQEGLGEHYPEVEIGPATLLDAVFYLPDTVSPLGRVEELR